MEWRSPTTQYQTAVLTPAEVRATFDATSESFEDADEVEVVGLAEIHGVRWQKRRFWLDLETDDGVETITGAIADDVQETIRLPAKYRVRLSVALSVDEVTGEEKEDFTLLQVDPLEP